MKIEIPKNFENAMRLLHLINHFGYSARLVGGCVRDAILNVHVNDIDIATTAFPENLKHIAEAAGISYAPTGLQHGTVTLTLNGESFEVTTLRIDRETDGRHATVEFTDDWAADAARRDFTFNALSMDVQGNIYDYFGGVNDLKEGRVKFIGDESSRIREDYLRILRYFRFCAKFNDTKIDFVTGGVIKLYANKLNEISKERIRMELWKMNSQNNFAHACKMMNLLGVSEVIFGEQLNVLALMHNPWSPILSFYTMGIRRDILEELKLSREETKILDLIDYMIETEDDPRFVLYKKGIDAKIVGSLVQPQKYNGLKVPYDKSPAKAIWVMRDFPVSGKELGDLLDRMDRKWCESNYILTYPELKKLFTSEFE